jgi:hypothetical protein
VHHLNDLLQLKDKIQLNKPVHCDFVIILLNNKQFIKDYEDFKDRDDDLTIYLEKFNS